MRTKDAFDPDHPLPLFLTEQTEQQGIGEVRDGAVTAPRFSKASILIATATAAAIAALWVADPVALFAKVTASLASSSSFQPGADPSGPKIQSAADEPASTLPTPDAQAVAPTAKDAPARDELAAAEPVNKDQAETSQPPSDDLFRQFQTWAAERNGQADVEPAQAAQDTPAQLAQDTATQDTAAKVQDAAAPVEEKVRAPHRLTQKHRQVRPVHTARAEIRTQSDRKPVRRVQSARSERRAVQDARAEAPRAEAPRTEDPPVQNAEVRSFLPVFGQRN